MSRKISIAVAAAVAALTQAQGPNVNTNNTIPVTFTTPAANPNGVQVAPTASILVTDTTAGANIVSLSLCFDHTLVYWQYSEALTCPAPESLQAAGDLTCAWSDSQTAPGGGCLTISGASTPSAYSDVSWQIRYINSGPFNGVVTGPRTLYYVATDSNGLTSPALGGPVVVNVVGDTTITPCPALNQAAGTIAETTTISAAQAATNAKVLVLSNFAVWTANPLQYAHIRITSGCLPEDTLVLNYATGAPLNINSQFFPATCDLTLTPAVANLPNATWTAALQNVAYQNTAAAGTAATVGLRGISLFLDQQNPVNCNTAYGSATINVLATLPTVSATLSPSASLSSAATPSVLPVGNSTSSALSSTLSMIGATVLLTATMVVLNA